MNASMRLTRHAVLKSAVCASLLHLSPPLPAVALGAADLRVAPPTVTDSYESWAFSTDVSDAVRSLRALLFTSPDAKIMAQSEDRRYMRVDFSDADLFSVGLDSCQFYLVPTGSRGGAAVVQCRQARESTTARTPLAALPSFDFRSRRLRTLRDALGWELRSSGSGDLSASFERLNAEYRLSPLGEGGTRLPRGSDAQLDALREQADEDFEWPPSAFPKPPPPERRNRPL